MSEEFDLIAEIREDQGKGASRRLRRQGKVPAIIYGAGRPPRKLAFDHNQVIRQLENQSFYSSVLNIKVGDKNQAAIVKDIQRHPVRRDVTHVDFLRIDPKQDVTVDVPIVMVGEAKEVTDADGMVDQNMFTLTVNSAPDSIPNELEVDISGLTIGTSLRVADIVLPAGITTDVEPEETVAVGMITRSTLEAMAADEAAEAAEAAEEGEAGEGAEDSADDTGAADEAALHQHYLRAARAAGVELVTRARIEGVERDGAGWLLRSSDGRHWRVDAIANAAGAWADTLAEMAGACALGIQPLQRTMLQLRAEPAIPHPSP